MIQQELDFIDADNAPAEPTVLVTDDLQLRNRPVTRTDEQSCQTTFGYIDIKPIRQVKKCDDKVKDCIANISAHADISIPKSRIAFVEALKWVGGRI